MRIKALSMSNMNKKISAFEMWIYRPISLEERNKLKAITQDYIRRVTKNCK